METSYFYVDESFPQRAGYWHCQIGGMFLPSEIVVDTEIALEKHLTKLAQEAGMQGRVSECKFSNFPRNEPDVFKFRVCAEIAELVTSRGTEFLVSHAKCRIDRLGMFASMPPSLAIQVLAHWNIPKYLADITSRSVVQVIVGLGLSESFCPHYNIYSGVSQCIPHMLAAGLEDDRISEANLKYLLPPAFIDSANSRVLEFSDLLVGLLLSREIGALTDFKSALLDAFKPVVDQVQCFTIDWNAKSP